MCYTSGNPNTIQYNLKIKQTAYEQEKAFEKDAKQSVRECLSCRRKGEKGSPGRYFIAPMFYMNIDPAEDEEKLCAVCRGECYICAWCHKGSHCCNCGTDK